MMIKKGLLKALAVSLCVILLISAFCVPALAAGKTEFGMIDEYQASSGNKNYVAEHEEALERLYAGCIDHDAGIDISDLQLPAADFYSLAPALTGIYPELFFVQINNANVSNGKLTKMIPTYSVGKEEADAMLEEFYAKADEYLAIITDDMDDFTKALVLHDTLVLNNIYEIPDSTNYTFMVKGWGRCENYVECYAYLLSKVGIKSEIINSDAMVHEWMKIQLDGSEYYYNVDITYDDPQYDGIGDLPDKAHHEYFLLSDDMIRENNDHYGYEYINESDGAYDDHINLHSLDNPIFYADGALYTLYGDGSKGYIATYDHVTDSFTNKLTINDVWYANASGTALWPGNFSGIGEYCGLLYYNGDNCIYMYDPVSGESSKYIDKVLTDGRHLYGMYIRDGKIYGRAAADPNSDPSDVYAGDCKKKNNIVISDDIIHGTVTVDGGDAAFAGSPVTLTVAPDEGYVVSGVWYNDNHEINNVDGTYTFDMPDEDAVITAEFGFADEIGARVVGYTLSLEGDIGVNFFMELSNAVAESEDAYMLFTVPNGDSFKEERIDVKAADTKTVGDITYYIFKCDVAAKEMNSAIKAQIINGDSSGTEYTYSVREYAEYILDHPEDEEYAAAADLVKAMLNYGAYSQVFFDNAPDALANAGLDENDRQLGNITAQAIGRSSFTDNLPAGVSLAGATLSLQSETTLSLYFISDSDLSFSCGGRTIETAGSGVYQIVRIRNIRAKELGDDFTVTVSAGENSGSVSYSPMNYCYNVLSGSTYTDDLKNVVKALYTYWKKAVSYFDYIPVA